MVQAWAKQLEVDGLHVYLNTEWPDPIEEQHGMTHAHTMTRAYIYRDIFICNMLRT